MPWISWALARGCSSSLSLEAGPPPLTSRPAHIPSSRMNTVHPVLICSREYQPYLTDDLRHGIYEFFPGWKSLPLIPLCYRVTDGREGCLEVTQHLLYGGQVRVTVSLDEDGNVVPEMPD